MAVTRAKETCTLSYATSRFLWGNLISSEPSRFIDEIDAQFVHFDMPDRGKGKSLSGGRSSDFDRPYTGGLNKGFSSPSLKPLKKVSDYTSSPSAAVDAVDLKVGYSVEHDRFGKGKVIKLEGEGSDKKATIFFPHHGSKTVLLRFAKLRILEN
ncbi:MAG: hypothetical protein A3D92_10715 [Bacteroidetes bacterium RIFCSPHIGHO2_02_FULL_44_7]|nr:MAG: hypothetical protein A3D92_10715 [Bacteroidetes bacterium RIFCSPHIGHO2_02_FULL_44_7]